MTSQENHTQSSHSVQGVPKQIYDQFLEKLATKDVPTDVIERLRTVLIEEGGTSDSAIREALFPTNNTET